MSSNQPVGTVFTDLEELVHLLSSIRGRVWGQLWLRADADTIIPSNWVKVTHANASRAALTIAVDRYNGPGVEFSLNDGTDLGAPLRQLINLDEVFNPESPTLFDA